MSRLSLTIGRAVAAAAIAIAGRSAAQAPAGPEAARCDSIIAAARVDSVPSGIFISVGREDEFLPPRRSELIAERIGAAFVLPDPLRLTVFAGPAQMRSFRSIRGDTATTLRAPTMTGVYRFVTNLDGSIRSVSTVGASLTAGFDVAAMAAIQNAATPANDLSPPVGEDSMKIAVRFSTDSTGAARRLAKLFVPRMPVVDAIPLSTNKPAVFPDSAKLEGMTAGEAVLRFVVERSGMPAMETVEVVRATSPSFLRASLAALYDQRFAPATIRGCAVAQEIDYPFSFILPDGGDGNLARAGKSIRH